MLSCLWKQLLPAYCTTEVKQRFVLLLLPHEGFTTAVANEGLEKARAYLNQVPRDQRLYIPSEGYAV